MVDKRYYWMKLKDSFLTSDTIDYFMSLPDGANYVVLYQMLCLKTINTGGRLSCSIGEIVIPYDAEKIHRDCRWFSIDTVRVALNLYKAVGLIYEDKDGTLVLDNNNDLVGCSTSEEHQRIGNAERQRKYRERQKQLLPEGKSVTVTENNGVAVDESNDDVTKSNGVTVTLFSNIDIDIDKDKDIDIDIIDINNNSSTSILDSTISTHDTSNEEKKCAKSADFAHSSKPYLLAQYLDEQICKRLGSAKGKPEKTIQRWAAAFDKCNRLDNHPWDEIKYVLRFSQCDSFWQNNILSGNKFREKYDQLLAKMKSTHRDPQKKQSATSAALSILQELHEEDYE